MRLRRHATTLAVAIACVAIAAALPALAHGVEHALFAHDAGQVDGFDATGAGTSAAARAGKLVATNADGQLPNNIIDRAPDASRLDGRDSTEYQQDLGRVITVAKSGGDFTSVSAALQSISEPSASRRYIVRVGPGVFFSAFNLTVMQFVTVEGAGPQATVLTMNSGVPDPQTAVTLEADATLRGLTVKSDDDHRTAISAASRAVIDEVRVDLDNGGTGVNVIGNNVTIDDLDVDIDGEAGSSVGVLADDEFVARSVSIEHSRIVVSDDSADAVRAGGEATRMAIRWSYLSVTGATGSYTAEAVGGADITIASSELHNDVSGSVLCRYVWTPAGEAPSNQCQTVA